MITSSGSSEKTKLGARGRRLYCSTICHTASPYMEKYHHDRLCNGMFLDNDNGAVMYVCMCITDNWYDHETLCNYQTLKLAYAYGNLLVLASLARVRLLVGVVYTVMRKFSVSLPYIAIYSILLHEEGVVNVYVSFHHSCL